MLKKAGILACAAAAVMLSGCSGNGDDTDAASIDASDGGIPLSAAGDEVLGLYMQARDLADRGDFIEANQAARRLTESHPDFAGGWIMLSNTALSGEQFVKAAHEADERSVEGTDGERLWADINMTFVSNDAEDGIALGEALVNKYPDAPRAWVVYGGLLTGQNRHEAARDAYAKAIDLDPGFAVAHVNLAFSYLYNEPQDFDRAQQHFQRTIEIAPGEDNYHVNIGDMRRAMGDLGAARDAYSRALQLDPENEVAAIKRAHVNSFLGNYDEARADYDSGIAVAQEGNKSTLANYRAFVNLHAGDAAAALGELASELERIDTLEMPADQRVGARIFVLTNMADVAFHNEMLDEAENAVAELVDALAELADNAGDEAFSRQTQATAAFWQGKLAARQGDYDAANRYAQEFARLVEDDNNPRKLERYHELLGLIALRRGEYENAIGHYRKANLSLSPGAGDVKNPYMLAQALEGAGRGDEAAEWLERIADWNFNSAWFAMLRKDAETGD